MSIRTCVSIFSKTGDLISTTSDRIDHWVKYRPRCSLNELPDMINFPHQAWLTSRGTVKWKHLLKSKLEKPMLKPLVEMALIGEIALQAKLAEMAGENLSNASTSIEYWSAIQGILTASANVSKILWPGKKRKARGDYLRKLLSVDEEHLLSDRSIRNSFEHYDERIEDWFEEHETAAYFDLALEARVPGLLMPPQFSHRSYDQYTHDLKFRDEQINIQELLSELAKLRERCRLFTLVHD